MKVILPGSYDPVTLGHLDLIKRASSIYDEVYAVIFINPEKKYKFSLEDRLNMLKLATNGLHNVTVDESDGYVIDYMRKRGLDKIIKGYRNETDFEYEKIQAEYNLKNGGFETELWKSLPEFKNISSSEVRARLNSNEKSVGELLPPSVADYIEKSKI